MGNILTMNQTMFGNKFVERRASKRARKAQVAEFEFSTDIVEMTYDECDEIDGGGSIRLGVKFTVGAVVSATVVSSIVGYLSGYCVTKAAKFGSMIGGFWGGIVGLIVGGLASWQISKSINDCVYAGTGGPKEITLIDIDTGFFGKSFNYYYDLGSLLGIVIGGGTGFGAAYALATA